MNKYMLAALKALPHVDIKKNYKLIRQAYIITKKPRIKMAYQTWSYSIKNNGHTVPIRVFSPASNKLDTLTMKEYPVIVFCTAAGGLRRMWIPMKKPA